MVSPVKNLDREEKEVYELTVIATDRGNPPLSSSVKLTITVDDENDNDPKFEKEPYSVSIPENIVTNTSILTIRANDIDKNDNGKVSYQIVKGDESDFGIYDSGIIRTKVSFDFEKKKYYKLVVEAFDYGAPKRKTKVDILINITDINDNTPSIESPMKIDPVNESTSIGKFITIKASDKDSGNNGKLKFSIKEETTDKYFEIDENKGELSLIKKLDREKLDSHNITIIVKDQGSPQPLAAEKTYTLRVLDDNDNPMVFTESLYEGEQPKKIICLEEEFWFSSEAVILQAYHL